MSCARNYLMLVLALTWMGGLACSPPPEDTQNPDNTNLNDNGAGAGQQDPDPGGNDNGDGSGAADDPGRGNGNDNGAPSNNNGSDDPPPDDPGKTDGNSNGGSDDPMIPDNGNTNTNNNDNTNTNDNGTPLPPDDDPDDDCPGGVKLSVSVAGGAAGSVLLDPPGGCYAVGESVEVIAQANPTFTFAGYSGAASGMDPVIMLSLDSDRSLSAQFIGNLFVVSSSNHLVLEVNPLSGEVIREFVPAGTGGLNAPFAVTFSRSGQLYITSQNGILEFDGVSGAFLRQFIPLGVGGLTTPFGITFGPNNNLFVTDTDKVREYNGTDGSFLDTFVTAGDGGLSSTTAIRFGPAGDLYVTGSGSVYRYDGDSGAFQEQFVVGLGNGSFDMVFGPNNDLFVSDALGGIVSRYNGTTGEAVSCPCLCLNPCPSDQLPDGPYQVDLESLPGPSGITFSHRGTLLVANQNSIIELDMLSGVPQNLGPLLSDDRIGTVAFIALKPLP